MVTRRYMNRNGRYTAKRYQKGLVRFCLAFWYGRLLDINAMWGPISSNFQKLRRIIQEISSALHRRPEQWKLKLAIVFVFERLV